MEKPATDIYTFKKLREGGYTYVDKTDVILQKRITLIGLGFSSEKRTVTDSAFEAL